LNKNPREISLYSLEYILHKLRKLNMFWKEYKLRIYNSYFFENLPGKLLSNTSDFSYKVSSSSSSSLSLGQTSNDGELRGGGGSIR
jgi:hypothetical protein